MKIRKHLLCDSRHRCATCSNYTWPPKMEKPMKFFRCDYCNLDFLCELGLAISYSYTADGMMKKQYKCGKCHTPVKESIWPEEESE